MTEALEPCPVDSPTKPLSPAEQMRLVGAGAKKKKNTTKAMQAEDEEKPAGRGRAGSRGRGAGGRGKGRGRGSGKGKGRGKGKSAPGGCKEDPDKLECSHSEPDHEEEMKEPAGVGRAGGRGGGEKLVQTVGAEERAGKGLHQNPPSTMRRASRKRRRMRKRKHRL